MAKLPNENIGLIYFGSEDYFFIPFILKFKKKTKDKEEKRIYMYNFKIIFSYYKSINGLKQKFLYNFLAARVWLKTAVPKKFSLDPYFQGTRVAMVQEQNIL